MQIEDAIEKAVKNSSSFREAARKLGKKNGNQWVKRKALEFGIDFSHFPHGCIYKKLVGEKFNMLRVLSIKPLHDKHRRVLAHCQCDCGNEKNFRCDGLKSGRYVSCGCHSKNRWNTVASKNHYFRGCGQIRGAYYSNLKRMAAKRNLEFTVSLSDLWQIFENQQGVCALTGLSISFGRIHFPNETTASPDRIDNTKGYVIGNIRWVIKDINMIRGGYDTEYFIRLCNEVARTHPRTHV